MMEFHAEDESDGEEIPHQWTSPITDEREGDTCNREQLEPHADILKYMESDHGDDACAYIRAKLVFQF